MAVHETKKQSDLEKRLRILRQSLSVTESRDHKKNLYSMSGTDKIPTTSSISRPTVSDVAFLKKDLTKIVLLSVLAFAVQFGIHFALINNIIKL
jgi:hypothetical protein